MLLLLSSDFAFIFLLNFFTLRTRVVLDSVLFLEFLLPDGADVEFMAYGFTPVHHLLCEEAADKLQQLVVVGGEAVVVVIEAADAPYGSIHIQIHYRTYRTTSRRRRIFLRLVFLRFGVAGLVRVEDALQFKPRLPILALYLNQVQISDLFSRQEKVMLVLAVKPDRELALANAELVLRLYDAFENLCQVF